jgi:hypothetical protein
MISVRMRNDGRLHGLPGIDEEITGRAVQAAARDGDQGLRFGHWSWRRFSMKSSRGVVMIRPAGADYNCE